MDLSEEEDAELFEIVCTVEDFQRFLSKTRPAQSRDLRAETLTTLTEAVSHQNQAADPHPIITKPVVVAGQTEQAYIETSAFSSVSQHVVERLFRPTTSSKRSYRQRLAQGAISVSRQACSSRSKGRAYSHSSIKVQYLPTSVLSAGLPR